LVNQKMYGKIVYDEIKKEKIDLNKKILYPFIRNITKVVKKPYGLVFLGKHGTGKTFAGQKVLYYTVRSNLTAHYIEFATFLKLLRRNFDENLDQLIEEILEVDFLMIDEIGNESKTSEFVIGEFKSLFKRRVQNNKPTILVTNFSYEEFTDRYGKSIESVVEANCKILNFKKVANIRRVRGGMEMDTFLKRISK